ncbi:MAG: hypothetical protein M0R06_00345 [Sphaerochaeta sp.]|nr:hypothetical protein [Sphaerochaeta sp.]
MIKCSCGFEDCATRMTLNLSPKKKLFLEVENTEGEERLWANIFLDANGIVELIAELKQKLNTLTEEV